MKQKNLIGGLILLVAILGGTTIYFLTAQKEKNRIIIDSEKDEHGCLVNVGYSWCQEKNKCLREFEESCKGKATVNDWKVYRNEIFGFEISYPPEIVLRGSTRCGGMPGEIPTGAEPSSDTCSDVDIIINNEEYPNLINASIVKKSEKTALDDFVLGTVSNIGSAKIKEKKKLVLDGKEAIVAKITGGIALGSVQESLDAETSFLFILKDEKNVLYFRYPIETCTKKNANGREMPISPCIQLDNSLKEKILNTVILSK